MSDNEEIDEQDEQVEETGSFDISELPAEYYQNWGFLQSLLDDMIDIKEKAFFLQTIISKNKYVCFHGQCPIFEKIRLLRADIIELGLSNTTIEKIQNSKTTKLLKLQRLKDLERLFLRCDDLLQEIMRIATVNKAIMDKVREENNIRLDIVKELNKSKMPIPFVAGKEVQSGLEGFKGFDDYYNAAKEDNDDKEKESEDKKS